MRKLTVLLCTSALASLLIGDTVHGPGPFDPNDYYFYWNMQMINTPSPPSILSYQGDLPYPYHCYATYQGTAPPPVGFNITCAAIAKAYITQRQDAAGGTISGACVQYINDWIYSDNENAYYGSIDGGVSMTVPGMGEDFEATDSCTATGGCEEINNGEPRAQDC